MQSGDLRIGATIEMDGNIYTVVECQRVQQPRLASFTRAKLKNVETGQSLEKRFMASENIVEAHIERREMQYLYNDGELYYFMDMESYEQMPLNKEVVSSTLPYMVENTMVTIQSCKGRVISVVPPLFVELKIVECEPAVMGDSARNVTKNAKMETGLIVRVPLFIDNGELIKIDTRNGEYVERVK